MKRIILFFSALALLASCSQKEHVLRICSVTDVHGKYFDSLFVGSGTNPGSLSKVSAFMKEVRKSTKAVVFIDNGDNLQGDDGAYYFDYVDTVSTHVYARMANYLGYDAVIVGNHDIEAGHPNYDRMKKQLRMPYLAANTPADEGGNYFESYTIVKKAGKKIGIIGLTNPNIKNWLGEPLWKGMDFVSAQSIAQSLVDEVRAKGADYVVFAIHAGTGNGDEASFEDPALFLAKNLKGVDVVVSGHDHRPRAEVVEENGCILINAGSQAKAVAVATIDLKTGERKSEIVELADRPADPEFNAEFRKDFEAVKAFSSQVVCTLEGRLDLGDAYDGPNPYVSLIHKVQLAATGAQLSFAAPLGRRNVLEAGEVLYSDLMKIYPYENQLYTVALTGRQIKDYLEYSYDNWVNGTGQGYNYDSAAGLDYKVFCARPKGRRVVISSLSDGTPFDLDATYTIAMTSYRASGGGYLLRDGAGINPAEDDSYIVEKYGFIRDFCYQYLKAQGSYNPDIMSNWQFVGNRLAKDSRPAQH